MKAKILEPDGQPGSRPGLDPQPPCNGAVRQGTAGVVRDVQTLPDLQALKARQKAIWESGDFGQVARFSVPAAEEFMARLPLRPGARVLDVACGTGNLAVIAARAGCRTAGVDIASNLVAQARARAQAAGLAIDYEEGDAEALPYCGASFDLVVTMFGAMFAPQPGRAALELLRVTKPGGLIAMANWTPEGFIGKMFRVFGRHLPPPAHARSPLEWGCAAVVGERLGQETSELRLTRRVASLRYPFSPAETIEFFRRYYGPTKQAFATLSESAQVALREDLEQLQAANNVSMDPNQTEVPSEYLEVHARRSA